MRGRKEWNAVTLMVVAASTLAVATPATAQQGRIEGTVVLAGGTPADDAEVSVVGRGLRSRVDLNGRFSFEELPPGTFILEATSPRWGRAVETITLQAAGTVRVELVLQSIFHLDEIVVSAAAGAVQRSEAYQPAGVVTSRDLVVLGEASLGETLSRQVGVNSTYFGPGASRPIIRGLGGDRVRILEGGIGVGDASSTSPDHAVGVDARSADRIEVVRGPATLLYGSSAVGGVVNVLDTKIARERPTDRVSGYVEALGGTVADERTGSANLSVLLGDFVLTGSGLRRDASDYAVPTAVGRGADSGEDRGTVMENSALATRREALGLSYVADRGYLGLAWSGIRSDYGVPGTSATVIELDQARVDLEGTLRMGSGAIRDVKARVGVADYQHAELENGEVATTFLNDYVEGRLDSQLRLGERTTGAVGAQFSLRDFEAIGDEAFVPASTTRIFSLFAYEGFAASETFRLQGGLRFERQGAEAAGRGVARNENAVSTSVGFGWDLSTPVGLSFSLSRSVKLPNAEELFSNGPHAATRAYEIGDPDLNPETALGADLTAHVHAERLRGTASVFATSFADYIHERATGDEEDGLTVFRFVQADARFTGFEVEGEVDVLEGDPARGRPHVSFEFLTDYVSARLTRRDEYLPRIPPLRVGGGINYRQGSLAVRGSARRTTGQTRVGPLEEETPGFTMVDASLSYRLHFGHTFHDITLVGSNLTNTEARLHTSFLKDIAPLPGREVRLVYRINF